LGKGNLKVTDMQIFTKFVFNLIPPNKGITAVIYNHLNLPVEVQFGANHKIVYLYDANGRKFLLLAVFSLRTIPGKPGADRIL
jgi:hypothetical protein